MSEIDVQGNGARASDEPYVVATVVAVERPVSAKPGDRATISEGGSIRGWIGGSCSEPIVVREAMAALADGRARLIRIRPPEAPREQSRVGVVDAITTCASEGGLDVFVEPRLPEPQLVVAGSSPINRTLTLLAEALGYEVSAALDDPNESVPDAKATMGLDELSKTRLSARDAVVVATMNRYDESALESAFETAAGYIGLVASRARAQSVIDLVRSRGADERNIERIHSPAGLDLGPSSQTEIALAVMAEIVSERHRLDGDVNAGPLHPEHVVHEAVDPVCGMTVAIVDGAITTEFEGVAYYFCSPGCRDTFTANPSDYMRVSP
jgi:xanthine dehydrogenase accessory factor